MASSTTNLNLLEPAPSENWSVQDHFNANMNKIDEFAGNVNGQLVKLNPYEPGWTANANLNNYTQTGTYYLSTGRQNGVGGDWGMLQVVGGRADTFNQIYRANGRIFEREYRASQGWTTWKELADVSRTAVSITASSNVTISANVSWAVIINGVLYLNVSGKANSAINNSDLFTLGMSKNVAQALIVPMGKSDDLWNVTSIGYAYISARTFVGRLNANEYFHISVAIPLAQ